MNKQNEWVDLVYITRVGIALVMLQSGAVFDAVTTMHLDPRKLSWLR